MQQLFIPSSLFPRLSAAWLPVLMAVFAFSAMAFLPGPDYRGSAPSGLLLRDTSQVNICADTWYVFGEDTLSASGIYTDTIYVDDSTYTLETISLTVWPLSYDTLSARICEGAGYVFGNDTLTEAGVYNDTLKNVNGCDSIVTLKLAVQAYFDDTLHATICPGDTYIFGHDTLADAGIYTDSLSAVGGCDSTVTLVLEFAPVDQTSIEAVICANESYLFGGETLTFEGTYVDTLQNSSGCDSIITLKLGVLPTASSAFEATICANEFYDFNGQQLQLPGVYTDTLQAENGCDSLVSLTLSVLPVAESSFDVTLCAFQTYEFAGQILDESGVYTDTLTAENGCDSLVHLNLNILPELLANVEASVCAGQYYDFFGQNLDTAGTYSVLLTAENGCDSVVLLHLSILPLLDSSFAATICANESYIFGNDTLTQAGVYTDTLTASTGCDSLVTLTLEVLPVAGSSLEATICANETYVFGGDTLAISGVYVDSLKAENGCDSLVTLTLNVLPLSSSDTSAAICAGETFAFGGLVLNESGIYQDTFTAANGCDSIRTLYLIVFPENSVTINAQICQGSSYLFNNQTLTESGTYTAVYPDVHGCDSTTTLLLEVLPPLGSAESATICAGETYSFNGLDLGTTGAYMAFYTTPAGCDSIVTLNLTVLPANTTTINASICPGETYVFNGQNFDNEGQYSASFTDVNGCDSTVTLNLNILPLGNSTTTATICANETYNFNGQILSQAGSYTATLTGVNGCDSIANLVLTVLPLSNGAETATICANESYNFHGQMLSQSGIYTAILTAANGCDSIVTLTLTVLPTHQSTQNVSICAGESYQYNGTSYTQGGAYNFLYTGANGCDSLFTLNLTVLPNPATTLNFTICAGTSLNYGGSTLTETGAYPFVFTSAAGCDSTVTVNLAVIPSPATVLTYTICEGTTLVYEGDTLSETGIYNYYFVGSTGCDSTVTIHLTIQPELTTTVNATICEGNSYPFDGQLLAASGTYSAVLSGPNGCDSTVVLHLTVTPAPTTHLNASICLGESYSFNGQNLTLPGTYTANLVNATGCDSIVVLALSVLQPANTSLSATICEGESYPFLGLTLTQPGVYTGSFVAANGCDSTVTLLLTVNAVQYNLILQSGTFIVQALNASFQWIDCDSGQPIAGATSSTFTPDHTGNYAVSITQNGCSTQSDCFYVEVVSSEEPGLSNNWLLAPNPARENAVVRLSAPAGQDLSIELFDMNGRLLQRNLLPQGASEQALDLGSLPAGVIMVRLSDGREAQTRRLVKAE
ncbi:MAG: T9SS type A sorting domain-containing protein [Saprospiraceae bacterium]